MPDPLGIDEVFAKATPRTETVKISLRGDLIELHRQLLQDLADAQRENSDTADGGNAPGIAADIVGLEAEIRASEVEFTFRQIGKKAWTDLKVAHQITDDEKRLEMMRIGIDYDPEVFPYEAMAASCVAPAGLTADKARKLEEVTTVGQWELIWGACLVANMGNRSPGESAAASAVLQRMRQSSEQPPASAGPAASS